MSLQETLASGPAALGDASWHYSPDSFASSASSASSSGSAGSAGSFVEEGVSVTIPDLVTPESSFSVVEDRQRLNGTFNAARLPFLHDIAGPWSLRHDFAADGFYDTSEDESSVASEEEL